MFSLLMAAILGAGSAQTAPVAESSLLVIAPHTFHAAIEEYVAHKRSQLPVKVASLEDVVRQTGGADDPEKAKRYIHDVWKECGGEWRGGAAAAPARTRLYVLLVGDADVFPVRYMVLDRITPEAQDYAFYPSDLYYADLVKKDGSFDDWNARKDGFHAGYYGEVRGEKNKDGPINADTIDYLPEAAVGRWPVSTPEEARIVAAKTIAYEKGILAGAKANERRAAFLSVGGWVDSRGLMDQLAAHLPPGWSAEKRYYRGGRSASATLPPTADQVITLLNEGIGLLCHAGHGQDDQWEGSFSLAHLAKVVNADRLPIVLSAGCSTARFATLPPYESYRDVNGKEQQGTYEKRVFTEPPPPPAPYQTGRYNPTGLGEQLLRRGPNGAVAYIGCNTGSQPCGLTLLEGFVLGLKAFEDPRLGDCWNHAIAHYYRKERLPELTPAADWYPPSIFFQGMKFMVFGDPSLLMPPAARRAGG
jgi:hypothetical protein